MTIRRFAFYLLSIFVILLCFRLSYWQWQRADEKRTILSTYQNSAKKKYIPIEHLLTASPKQYESIRYVQLEGHYLKGANVLIDNQMVDHNPGYDVLTAFKTLTNHIVWINRGWIKAPLSRTVLPAVPEKTGLVTLHATVLTLKKAAFRIGSVQDPDFPQRFQVLDLNVLNHYSKRSELNSVMILDSNEPGAFHYHYKPVVVLPARHIGYAVQWFLIAVVWIVFTVYAKI